MWTFQPRLSEQSELLVPYLLQLAIACSYGRNSFLKSYNSFSARPLSEITVSDLSCNRWEKIDILVVLIGIWKLYMLMIPNAGYLKITLFCKSAIVVLISQYVDFAQSSEQVLLKLKWLTSAPSTHLDAQSMKQVALVTSA